MKKLMMSSIIRAAQIRESARDDRGGVAAEYGVLLAGIVGVVAIAAAALGGRIGGLFDSILP
jgi:Flp pilus assembly pilin Flp